MVDSHGELFLRRLSTLLTKYARFHVHTSHVCAEKYKSYYARNKREKPFWLVVSWSIQDTRPNQTHVCDHRSRKHVSGYQQCSCWSAIKTKVQLGKSSLLGCS